METSTHPAARHPLSDPSKEIRVLRLDPGAGDSISGTLSIWTLQEAPPYEAISYQWGDPEIRHDIVVDGAVHQAGQNCRYALWQASLHQQCQYLWIDSVCINQSDTAEKSAQVGIMAKIYARSRRVLASLGEASPDDEALIELFQEMEVQCSSASRRSFRRADWATGFGEVQCKQMLSWMRNFAAKPYFWRLWIIQELYMAPQRILMCGGLKIMSDSVQNFGFEFFYYFELQHEDDDEASSQAQSRAVVRSLFYQFEEDYGEPDPQSMWALARRIDDGSESSLAPTRFRGLDGIIESFERWQCSDPRDRIFGLLALVRKGSQLVPDYGKTSWQIALEAITSDDFLHVEQFAALLFRLLKLERSAEFAAAIKERQSGYQLAVPTADLDVPERPLEIQATGEFIIWHDGAGRLVASGECREPECLPRVADVFRPPCLGPEPFDIEVQRSQRVFAFGGPCALVSLNAQPGDRVVLFNAIREHMRINRYALLGLVIRKRTFRTFSMVGYAVVSARFRACKPPGYIEATCSACKGLPYAPFRSTTVRLCFDGEDMLVMSHLQGEFGESGMKDAEWYGKLLATRPTRDLMSSYARLSRYWWRYHGYYACESLTRASREEDD